MRLNVFAEHTDSSANVQIDQFTLSSLSRASVPFYSLETEKSFGMRGGIWKVHDLTLTIDEAHIYSCRLQSSYISLSSIDFYSNVNENVCTGRLARIVCCAVCVPFVFGRCLNMGIRNTPFNSTISMLCHCHSFRMRFD